MQRFFYNTWRSILLIGIAIWILPVSGYSQKIKYKDLFVILHAKKYDQAEPFLRSYLSDPKNTDEPNANLQMGMLMQSKAEKLDIVNETEAYNGIIDTALIYYSKSLNLITEKEVKKHDEYYEDYYRRDLRTGKMGVKLSDVRLDIENRIEDLSSRSSRINQMKASYTKAIEFYAGCTRVFNRIEEEHDSYNQMLIRGRDGIVSELDSIQIYFDSMFVRRENYFNIRESLEKFYERPVLEEQEIKEFEPHSDGLDLQAELVKVWSYKTWAVQSRDLVIDETRPLHAQMVAYDAELAGKVDELSSKQTSLPEESITEMALVNTITKYDQNALPLKLYNYRIKKINYLSESNEVVNSGQLDTLNLAVRSEVVGGLDQAITPLSFIHDSIAGIDIKKSVFTYSNFVNERFGGEEGLQKFIDDEAQYIESEKQKWRDLMLEIDNRRQYIVKGADSIRLSVASLDSVLFRKYSPFISVDTIPNVVYTSGWYRTEQDSLKLYSIVTDGTLIADTLILVQPDSVMASNYTMIKTKVGYNPLERDVVALDYIPLRGDSIIHSTITKINSNNQQVWSKYVDLAGIPEEIEYVPESSIFIVRFEAGEGEEQKTISFDMDGNIREENQ